MKIEIKNIEIECLEKDFNDSHEHHMMYVSCDVKINDNKNIHFFENINIDDVGDISVERTDSNMMLNTDEFRIDAYDDGYSIFEEICLMIESFKTILQQKSECLAC